MSTKCMIFVEVSPEDLGKVVKPDKQLIYAKGLQFQDWDDEEPFQEEDIDKLPEVLLNKRFIGIYDHWDGHPLVIGYTLLESFNTYKDALNLMLFGDESSIIDYLSPHALSSTVYKDENVTSPLLVDEIPTDLAYSRESDFIYLFKNGVWLYALACSGKSGRYIWYPLEEALLMDLMPELIKVANRYSNDPEPEEGALFIGSMLIRGKKSNLKQFLLNACSVTELNNSNIIPVNNHWRHVDCTKRAFIRPLKTYDLTCMDDDITALFLYKQAYELHIDHLVTFSQRYHVDFRLFVRDEDTTICRNVEITDGKIIINEHFLMAEYDVEECWPIISFGDTSLQKQRVYHKLWKCATSPDISAEHSEILKAVADEQRKRFIEKCPCCGKAEMFTYRGKTDGWPNSKAGIYICDHCSIKELEGTLPPLSKWAVFKEENAPVFFPEEGHVDEVSNGES